MTFSSRTRLLAPLCALTVGLVACGQAEDGASPAPSTPPVSAGAASPAPSAFPTDQATSTDEATDSSQAPTSQVPTASPLPSSGSGATRRPADISSPDSLTVLVNKQNPLNPITYAPADLVPVGSVQLRAEAAEAAERMMAAAASDGAPMFTVSGFRSYETQQGTYSTWVAQQGQEYADTASARPGYSEHQTGLAIDIGTGTGCDLQPCFKDTAAAMWVAEHAHEYGFVVRYPWWHHETTGYWYESWHLRFIGVEEAMAFKQSGFATLEEFWGTGPAPTY